MHKARPTGEDRHETGIKSDNCARRFDRIRALGVPSQRRQPLVVNRQSHAAESDESIIVTGYRASLDQRCDRQSAKRSRSSDSIFAEDIGKFPDTNIAESLNRIPGVTISREINGDGLQRRHPRPGHQLHHACCSTARRSRWPRPAAPTRRTPIARSISICFPTELFTQLTVSKIADRRHDRGRRRRHRQHAQRAAVRPHPGTHISYGVQLTNNSNTNKMGLSRQHPCQHDHGRFRHPASASPACAASPTSPASRPSAGPTPVSPPRSAPPVRSMRPAAATGPFRPPCRPMPATA